MIPNDQLWSSQKDDVFFTLFYFVCYSHVTEEGISLLPEALGCHVGQEMLPLSHKVVVPIVKHARVGYLGL